MAIDLEDKTVLVTCGSTGMGRASALASGRKGAKVAISDLNVEDGKEILEMVKEAQGEATFIEVDVSKSVEDEALIDRVNQV
jgi:NAD(P)-dependent dehydrogenase (short-subunit alcohol dehydrogenase family)